MSKINNKGLSPRLRFSGFQNRDWMQANLVDIASLVTDYVANGSFQALRENVNVSDKEDEAYYVRLTDLRAGLGHKDQKYVNKSSFNFLGKSALRSGDLLMANIGANVGEVWQMPKADRPATLAPNMIMARFDENTSDSFVFYYLNSHIGKLELSKAIGGGAHPKLNKTDLKQVSVFLPKDKEEQQIIADCLSSLDELITAHTQKHEALQTYKKGLIQNLFPADGESVPAFRFPEFSNAGDWVIKPMIKLFKIGNGRDHKHLADGDIPVYGSGGYMRSVNEYLYDGESACIGRKGTIDKPIFLFGKFWTVDTLFYTHSFKGCLPKFIYLIFQNIDWRSHNEAGGVPSLSKSNIEKIEVTLPDLDEQRKIIACIFSADELITFQEEKIEELKVHKKGLMQKLFPAVDEVNE